MEARFDLCLTINTCDLTSSTKYFKKLHFVTFIQCLSIFIEETTTDSQKTVYSILLPMKTA